MSTRTSARRRHGRRRRLAGGRAGLLVAAAIAVAVLVVAGAQLAGRDGEETPPDPGVAHVHGLGINPADGSLIVATHFGSFRIAADGDDAERIGHSFQDTMGFTVVGPNRFLGSGHPDFQAAGEGQPTRLGLIESTDAGVTWRNVSLDGEADFHGLAVAHGQVYGWDASTGRFMVSTDRRRWETRSTAQLLGFAVDPEDPDHIMGAGPAELRESSDGGRTWSDSAGPSLVALSWDKAAGLWGADRAGTVWRRDASEWRETGELPGEPQALLATPDALYAAVHDADEITAIYRSTDQGRTWQLRYRDTQS